MKSLKSRGIEDLDKVINRIARSWGLGRISHDEFQDLNNKAVGLRNALISVNESDDDDEE